MWGFESVYHGPGKCGYRHELFIRGNTSLCQRMKRTKVKGSRTSRKAIATANKNISTPAITALVSDDESGRGDPVHLDSGKTSKDVIGEPDDDLLGKKGSLLKSLSMFTARSEDHCSASRCTPMNPSSNDDCSFFPVSDGYHPQEQFSSEDLKYVRIGMSLASSNEAFQSDWLLSSPPSLLA